MLRLTPLDVLWQFAAASCFQLLHHIGTKLGNQAEDVFGFKILKALSIHRAADRHIAGKAQQLFIHILRGAIPAVPCRAERR